MADRPTLKPWIEAIHAYVPGKSKAADGARWSNCRPMRSPRLQPESDRGAGGWARAEPLSRSRRHAVARMARARHRSGADRLRHRLGECLHGAVQAFAGPGDQVLFSRYSFAYPLLAHKVGAEAVLADDPITHPISTISSPPSPSGRAWFCSTSEQSHRHLLPRAEVERLHAGLPTDVLLVVDQAYAEFLPEGEDDGGMIAVVTTMSSSPAPSRKPMDCGRARGLGKGAPHLIDALNRLRGAFNVKNGQRAALRRWRTSLRRVRAMPMPLPARASSTKSRRSAITACACRARPISSSSSSKRPRSHRGPRSDCRRGYAVRHLPGQGLPQALRTPWARRIRWMP